MLRIWTITVSVLIAPLIPDALINFVRREHSPRVLDQQKEDLVLDGRQLDLLSVDNDLVVIFIDGEATDRDLVLCRFSGAAVRV